MNTRQKKILEKRHWGIGNGTMGLSLETDGRKLFLTGELEKDYESIVTIGLPNKKAVQYLIDILQKHIDGPEYYSFHNDDGTPEIIGGVEVNHDGAKL